MSRISGPCWCITAWSTAWCPVLLTPQRKLLFTRYAAFGMDLQQAISAPRWLLGRTWGEESTSLKLESRFDPELVDELRRAGHVVEMVGPMTATMGHAGAIVRRPDGAYEAATDPRSDGAALAL